MNERSALAIIERDHGSLEDFAIEVLSEKRDALDSSIPITKRAQMVGLPVTVFARILASSQFRQMLRVDLVNDAFDIEAEREHVSAISNVARGRQKAVVTPQGQLAHVDQSPRDVMEAGRYLNELRGTPIDKGSQSAPSVVINIGQAEGPSEDERVPTTIDVAVEPHQPQRAGSLPPPGIRARLGETASGDAPVGESHDPDLGTFYGDRAEEEDEDSRIAEKAQRLRSRNEIDLEEEDDEGEVDARTGRKIIGRRRPGGSRVFAWPSKRHAQVRVPVYEGDD